MTCPPTVLLVPLAFVLVTLPAVVAGQATKPALPGPDLPAGLGVNIHFTDPKPGEVEMLAAAGVGIVRMDFTWSETEKARGRYDFTAYERLLTALEAHRIRPLFILDYVNQHYDDAQSPHTPEGRAAMARWAAAAAKHFAGRGILWEMYNEPNITPFWRPEPNVDHYAKLALEVGQAIRAVAPGETYVGPATSAVDLPFLEACFKAGLLEYWDAVTVHPYRQTNPETVADDYRSLRLLIAKYAPRGKTIPILSGEWGYSSVWSGMTDEKQGKLLPRQWLTNLANDVPVSIWYDWHDDGPDPREPEHHFGTVAHPYHENRDPVYDPKPAYRAARTLTTQLKGYRFNKRLALESPDDYLLLFTKGDDTNDVKLVAWTTAKEGRQVTLPASPGAFTVVSHAGTELPHATADEKGLVATLTDAPRYLTPDQPNDLLRVAAAWRRAPLEDVVRAPGVVSFELEAHNPLGRDVEVQFVTARQDLPVRTLKPGSRCVHSFSLLATRRAEPFQNLIRLRIDGRPCAAQTVTHVVSNPIGVTLAPAAGNVAPILLRNPSGEPFQTHVSIFLYDSDDREWHGEPEVVRFAAGETEKVVRMRCKLPWPTDVYRLAVGGDEKDETGRVVSFHTSAKFIRLALEPGTLTLHPDGDAKVASDQSHAAADAPAGLPVDYGPAVRIDYRFDPGWKFVRLSPRAPELQAIPGKPKSLGLWIHGDGSGNFARARFVDRTNQTFQPDGPKLTFTGWRYVEFPLDGTKAGHWGGAADGVVRYPIRLDTLFLLDNATRRETTGTVYVTAPTLVYVTGEDNE